MCGRSGRREERRERRNQLISSIGQMAWDVYQGSQAHPRGIPAGQSTSQPVARNNYDHYNQTKGQTQPRDGGLADDYYQQHGIRVSRRESHIPDSPPVWQMGSGEHMEEINGEVLKTAGIAPPSYEESVNQANGVRSPPQGDVKRKPVQVVEHDDEDDSSEVSSIFETTGMMTPNTEMEANQGRNQNDLVAQAARSIASQDQKRPPVPGANESTQSRSLEPQNQSASRSNMENAQISSIAQWLSQHESPSEHHSVQQDRPSERSQAQERPRQVPRDSFEEYWEKHPEHRPENLGLDRHETKLAIKAAYKAEKRALRANYRAEKQAAKTAKAYYKAEMRGMRHGD